MDFSADERNAILSKAVSLIDKINQNLNKLDVVCFPTPSSETALNLIKKTLKKIKEPGFLGPVNPEVLYNRLFSLLDLVKLVEQSSHDNISWPLVNYCDKYWKDFFDDNSPHIFYSVTDKHNYYLSNFTETLSSLLDGVLPPSEIQSIINSENLYCLQLASSEEANLPLYSLIAHEFGHAIFKHHEIYLRGKLDGNFFKLLDTIFDRFKELDPSQADRRISRFVVIIYKVSEEILSDLVGAILMGPAFFLSLYEFSWGKGLLTKKHIQAHLFA
jgi:hypothetical protein